MTVTSSAIRATYAGSGTTGPFPFSFRILAATDVEVIVTTGTASVTLSYPADYSVSGVGNGSGGSITLTNALTAGQSVLIRRELDITQPTSLRNQSKYYPESIEDALDRDVMMIQQLVDNIDRSFQLPTTVDPATVSPVLPTPVANRALFWNVGATALENRPVDNSSIALPGGGRTVSTVTAYLANNAQLNLRDFGAVGNGIADDTVAVQAWVDACSFDTQPAPGSPVGKAIGIASGPAVFKITAPIRFKKSYVTIDIGNRFGVAFDYSNVAGGGFVADTMVFFRPRIRGFSVVGNSASGHAFDFSAVTGFSGNAQVYNGSMEDLWIYAGKQAIRMDSVFSYAFRDIQGHSYTDHVFQARCGPGVAWDNVYAGNGAAGKTGFRLCGTINMRNCNGVDNGADSWGVFGSNTALSNGFQNDFPLVPNDYPSMRFDGCNFENWNTNALIVVNAFSSFAVNGGTIVRNGTALAAGGYSLNYHSDIRIYVQGLNSANIVLDGLRTVYSGGAPTAAHVYADAAGSLVLKNDGTLFTGIYNAGVALTYPAQIETIVADVYNDKAMSWSAISPRRLSVNVQRFNRLDSATTGANQTIDVTGKTAVFLAPASASSYTVFSFTQTPGAGLDRDRNGFLIIHVESANVTLKHLAGGSLTMKLLAGRDYAATSGDVLFFILSSNIGGATTGWLQVGGPTGIKGSATYDPPSLATGAGATTTVTVTGAVLGDTAVAAFSLDLQGITVTAWVSAANTVSVRFQNQTGGTIDLASGTLSVRII